MNGFDFVLNFWPLLFDLYNNIVIARVDQWVRISISLGNFEIKTHYLTLSVLVYSESSS